MSGWFSFVRASAALTGALSMVMLCSPNQARAESSGGTKVHVIETSLGLTNRVRLLRHLALRFGSEDDFVEAHFGPGTHGEGREGFLDTGKGKIADQEYLAVIDAGSTKLSKEEALNWCKEWAKDRVYITVGQNCWTMVHDFLETHEGCEINDELKFKEQQINHSSQMLVRSMEYLAEQQGRSTDEVMRETMKEPSKLLPVLFSAENMQHFMPTNVQDAIQNGYKMAAGMSQSDWSKYVESIGMGNISDRMQQMAGHITQQAKEKEAENKGQDTKAGSQDEL